MQEFEKNGAQDENVSLGAADPKKDKMPERALQSGTLSRFENYWYHYKWHTIGAVLLVLVALVCILQMCGRESGDISFLQVGGKTLSGQAQGQIRTSLSDSVLEEDECKVSFITHYIESTEMFQDMEDMDAAFLANTSYENANAFRTQLATVEAYICLLSRDVYELSRVYYPDKRDEGDSVFYSPLYRPLSDFKNDLTDTYDDYAVYLHKTPLAELPGFKSMPRDTLLCFRRISYMATVSGKKKAEAVYRRHEDVFSAMLAYDGEGK